MTSSKRSLQGKTAPSRMHKLYAPASLRCRVYTSSGGGVSRCCRNAELCFDILALMFDLRKSYGSLEANGSPTVNPLNLWASSMMSFSSPVRKPMRCDSSMRVSSSLWAFAHTILRYPSTNPLSNSRAAPKSMRCVLRSPTSYRKLPQLGSVCMNLHSNSSRIVSRRIARPMRFRSSCSIFTTLSMVPPRTNSEVMTREVVRSSMTSGTVTRSRTKSSSFSTSDLNRR
mmetsp:Transcript_35084/g.104702  ORF Transcript_35084/g.104702 Transcript_35084/m.104702 type:complete len:228 (-) Transcript_35084:411-1094(-)